VDPKTKNTVVVDNRYVVGYNPYLLMHMRCHINVEIVTTNHSIKYLFKYLNKGTDRATVAVAGVANADEARDEIKEYTDARWIGSCEAV